MSLPVFLILIASLVAGPPASFAGAETATEWLTRSQTARFPGRTLRATFVMRVTPREGAPIERRGATMRQSRGAGLADQLFVINEPNNLKDLTLLSRDRAGEPAAQWLYMPVYRRARRVSLQASSDAFVGSDFTYQDFGRVRIEVGSHTLGGESEFRGRRCIVVETVADDASVPYRRLRTTLDRETALPLQLEYYDGEGQRTRVGVIEKIDTIAGFPTPVEMSITNEASGSRSTVTLNGAVYDVDIDPTLFTVEHLESSSREH